MKKLSLGLLFVLFSATASAQTHRQRGVVRMITSSASSPTMPVKGVNVVVENNVSGATGADGVFRVDVTEEFVVSGIVQSEYILALPTRGRAYYYSENDLDVVVTTRAQRDADYKRLYQQIKAKYDAQSDELNRLRREYKRRLADLDAADAEYVDLQVKIDSIQRKYQEYIDNEDKIDAEIRRISEELSITDYQTLDSLEQRIYDLKCAGEWKSLTALLQDVMKGDAEAYLQEGISNHARAEVLRRKAAANDSVATVLLNSAYQNVEDAIEAFEKQGMTDSVAKYREILNAKRLGGVEHE